MNKIGIISTLVLLCLFTNGYAQNRIADGYFDQKKYNVAAEVYQKSYDKGKATLQDLERLAYCYRMLNRYEEAEIYYAKAVQFPKSDADNYKYYGQLLLNQNKIRQARAQFEKYVEKKPNDPQGKALLESCDHIKEWTSNAVNIQASNLEAVNSSWIEMAPFPMGDKILFSSDKISNDKTKADLELEFYPFSIYVYDPNNKEEPIKEFSEEINSKNNGEGPAYLNSTRDEIAYTFVSNAGGSAGQLELNFAHKEGDKWIVDDPFTRNNVKYAFTDPVWSNDGTTLYFSSDKTGGKGGLDIWFSTKKGILWSLPQNLGEKINTKGDESPCYIDENDVLYFSSTGHPGFGGRDLFSTEMVDGRWVVPTNLGPPYNSSKDDLYFIKSSKNKGYFSSNRDNGKGEDDIYSFEVVAFSQENYFSELIGTYMAGTTALTGKSIILLDDNNVIIRTTTTDENGVFTIDNVPKKSNYSVIVDEDPEELPENATITIINSDNDKSSLMERVQKGLFTFNALDIDEGEDLTLMNEPVEYNLPTIAIFGQLEDKSGQNKTASKRVYVIDEFGNTIASAMSDHLGKFQFEKLAMDEQYLFKLEEEDIDVSITIINTDGEVIGRTIKNTDGIYVYHKFTINPSDNPDVRGLFKYGNLPADGVKLKLLSADDEVLMLVTTDEKGEFEFTGLDAGTKYRIEVDSKEEVPVNAQMFLVDKHTGLMMPVSKLANGNFHFETLSPMPADELELMAEDDYELKPRHDLRGQVYSAIKEIPSGLVVEIMNKEGKVIAIAKTDHKGVFNFFNLPIEDQYLFNIPEDDATFSLRVIGNDDEVIGEAKKNDDNHYVYHKFTINPADRPDIRGLFKYGNLPANDVMLNLLDESDEVLQVTKTDAKGEFAFKELHAGQSYRIKVDKSEGDVPDNATMYIMDQYTGLMLPVSKLANGEFKFETLSPIEPEELTLVEEDDDDDVVRFSFFAQLLSTEAEIKEGHKVYVIDENGNVIASAVTDKYGKFNYDKLPLQDEYLLRMEESDENMQLFILSKEGNNVGDLKQNSNGDFVFNREELYSRVAKTDEEKFNALRVPVPPYELPEDYEPHVHFDFNGHELNDNIRKNLDYLIKYLAENEDIHLDIGCHTDARGTAEYNMNLSEMRGEEVKKYMTQKGIEKERISLHAYGETKLLNECRDNVDCPDSKHAENRRVELRYFR